MKCLEASDHLSAYLDDALEPELRQELEAHLAGCASCRRELEEVRRTIALCRALPEVPAPAGFRQAVGRAVRGAAHAPPWRRLGSWWGGLPYRGVAVAAAVLALAFVLNLALEGPLPLPAARLAAEGPEDLRASFEPAQPPKVTGEALEGKGGAEPAPRVAEFTTTQGLPDLPVPPQDRKIIRNADLELAVEDFDRVFQEIIFLAEASGGYVESSSFWKGEDNRKGGTVRLRVPQQSFGGVLAQIEGKGQLLNRNIYGQDVTQAYVDTEARLKTLELQEQRLLQILGRASTVGEILQVESELARVRFQIESLTATLRNYDRLVNFSTISVNLVPPKEEPPPPATDIWTRIVEAFLRSLRWLLNLGERLVVFVSSLAPVIALAILAYLGWRFYRRRGRAT